MSERQRRLTPLRQAQDLPAPLRSGEYVFSVDHKCLVGAASSRDFHTTDFLVAAGSRSYDTKAKALTLATSTLNTYFGRGENDQVRAVLTPRTFDLCRQFTDSRKTHPEFCPHLTSNGCL